MAQSKTAQGKEFEKDFENSIPVSTWCYRIPDNASSFGGGTASRFTSDSRYDYLCWNGLSDKNLYSFELKSTEGTSISFADYALSLSYELTKNSLKKYRELIKGTQNDVQKEHIKLLKDEIKVLSKKCKAPSIKYHQIKNLYIDYLSNSKSYFIFNFRKTNTTYAVTIQSFISWWKTTNKKSINQDDIKTLEYYILPQEPIGRTKHWKYNTSVIGLKEQTLNSVVLDTIKSETPFLHESKKNIKGENKK